MDIFTRGGDNNQHSRRINNVVPGIILRYYDVGMNKHWKTLKREEVLDSPWYQVFRETVRLPSGKVLDDYFVRDSVKAVLIVPHTKDGAFIMTKQYKHGAQQVVLEFPAGKIDEGEDVMTAARRELREETGAEADTMTRGPTFFEDPTNSRCQIFVVFAEGVHYTQKQALDDNEDIEIITLSQNELEQALTDGELQIAASVAAGYMAIRRLS
ncbi:MAG TPA: NUDIX hydrolase [Candidatus Saccharimonadales bacterium]|nr:NUDIX hydrolase [Candidatus Saccharimonadales bacterium]